MKMSREREKNRKKKNRKICMKFIEVNNDNAKFIMLFLTAKCEEMNTSLTSYLLDE